MSPTRSVHALLAVVAAGALATQTAVSVDAGRSVVDLWSYFTIQSNLLVAVSSALLAARPDRDERWFRVLRLAALLGITVTGLVYVAVLAGTVELRGVERWLDVVFHYVVPIGAVATHLLVRPRTRFAGADVVALVWPVAWLAYTVLRAEVGSPAFAQPGGVPLAVPYPFLDAGELGVARVAVNAVVVTALFLLLAVGYVRVSRRASPGPAA